MDAVKYLKTLSKMKETDSFSVEEFLDFIGKTPEHKVEFVEEWAEGHEPAEWNVPIEKEFDGYRTYVNNRFDHIERDVEHHMEMIQKLQYALFATQMRIDDCEDDLEDLRIEVHHDDE